MGYRSLKLQRPIVVDEVVSIHYFEYTSTYAFEGEAHDFWEFLYVDKGQVAVQAGAGPDCLQESILKKGQMIFHKPGEFHSLRACGGTAPNLVVIGFVCRSEAMSFFENRLESLGDSARALLATVVKEAEGAFTTPLGDPQTLELHRREGAPFGAEELIGLCLEQLLVRLYRRGGRAVPGEEKPTSLIREHSQQEFIDRVTKYLEANLSRKLTLADICRDNLIGRSYLQKMFREKTGGGAMEYFGSLKIEAAKEKIREGSHNFTEIASMLGYTSIHYFSRHFKKVTGMTPSEYASSIKGLSGKTPGDEL